MSSRAPRIPSILAALALPLCVGCGSGGIGSAGPAESSALHLRPRCEPGCAAFCSQHLRVTATLTARGSETLCVDRHLGHVSKVTEAREGRAEQVQQTYGLYRMTREGPREVQPQELEPDVNGLTVRLDRARGRPTVRVLRGAAPPQLRHILTDMAFEDCLPTGPVAVGDAWQLSGAQAAAWGLHLDPVGGSTDEVRCRLTGVRRCRPPVAAFGEGIRPEPIRCAVIAVHWRHDGRILDLPRGVAELRGTVWVDVQRGRVVRRSCWGTVQLGAGGEGGAGPDAGGRGSIYLEQTSWPITAEQYASYGARRGAPPAQQEVPSSRIFRAAAPVIATSHDG